MHDLTALSNHAPIISIVEEHHQRVFASTSAYIYMQNFELHELNSKSGVKGDQHQKVQRSPTQYGTYAINPMGSTWH